MALSNLGAIIAGLSLPVKAAAASTVAVAALGGGAAVTSTPPETPPAAEAGLDEAEENTGFPVPADGQPEGLRVGEDEEAGTEEDDVEAGDAEEAEHGVDGQAQAEKARTTQDKGEEFGQETAAEASGGKSTEGRQGAAEARANAEQAEARRQDAKAREAEAREREEAQDREAETEARAEAEARSQAGRDNATSSDDTEDEVETEDAADQSSTGTVRSGAGRANAQDASGR